MKINYDLKLQELINNLDYKPTLLLHSCCGPCSSYVISYLKDYFKITVIYYNPNIEPIEEYNKRKSEQLRLLKELNIDYIDSPYENDLYHEEVKGHEEDVEGGNRCHLCYELRIKKTYLYAKENNFEYFGTTLTVSPYKNANIRLLIVIVNGYIVILKKEMAIRKALNYLINIIYIVKIIVVVHIVGE